MIHKLHYIKIVSQGKTQLSCVTRTNTMVHKLLHKDSVTKTTTIILCHKDKHNDLSAKLHKDSVTRKNTIIHKLHYIKIASQGQTQLFINYTT